MADVHVFTSAAANYLPKVQILFETLREYHPQWQRHLVLVEDTPVEVLPADAGADSVLSLETLEIPDWRPWSFCHRLVELATAVKPFALRQLLRREGVSAVIYLDPDIALFSPLDEVLAALEEVSILLTPHQLQAETLLARVVDNEISSLKHGVYNLGFLAVAADGTGVAFAEWWCQRLYRFCRDDIPNGLFTDQRWMDLVPALFPNVGVQRSPRLNVASWNLSQRDLARVDGGFCVGDEPLGFYHFTGLSSDSHELMALKNSDMPAAFGELVAWYREREQRFAAGAEARPWSLGQYSDGTPIADTDRVRYRDSPDLQKRFADPYDARGYGMYAAGRDAAGNAGQPGAAKAPAPLSLGFSRSDPALDGQKLQRLIGAMLRDPRVAKLMARRLLQVLDSEGISGVLRRLR